MDSSLQLISVSVILITFLICLVGINSKSKKLLLKNAERLENLN